MAASLIKTQRFRLPTLSKIRVLEPLSCRKYKLELKPCRKFSKILLEKKPNKELQAVWACIAQDDIFMGHAITFYGVLSLRSSGAGHYTDATPQHRMRNYFKGQVDFTLNPGNNLASGLFLVFESGQLPSFVTPAANSLKVGFASREISANTFAGE